MHPAKVHLQQFVAWLHQRRQIQQHQVPDLLCIQPLLADLPHLLVRGTPRHCVQCLSQRALDAGTTCQMETAPRAAHDDRRLTEPAGPCDRLADRIVLAAVLLKRHRLQENLRVLLHLHSRAPVPQLSCFV